MMDVDGIVVHKKHPRNEADSNSLQVNKSQKRGELVTSITLFTQSTPLVPGDFGTTLLNCGTKSSKVDIISNHTTFFVADPKFQNHPQKAPICIYVLLSRCGNRQIGVYHV